MTINQKELGRRIRIAREACGMLSADAASLLGVSPEDYDQIEAGRRPVSTRELERLAYLFGRDVREFAGRKFPRGDMFVSLYLAYASSSPPEGLEEVRQCISLVRAALELKRLAGDEQAEPRLVSHLKRVLRPGRPDAAKARQELRPYLLSLAISAYRRGALSLG
ncbi:MAG: hypothetical protein C4308_15025, partial [Chitinophagaceae bacterium]